MNSIIIREIRRRPKLSESNKPAVYRQGQGQSEGQGETSKNNNSEFQILIILLLVTFVFLLLSTPVYVFFMYINIVDYEATPRIYAGYILFHSVGQKLISNQLRNQFLPLRNFWPKIQNRFAETFHQRENFKEQYECTYDSISLIFFNI